ncbi:MAG: 23S rRNA (adenine(2503)-C(2))-methyltransferase RlmN [Oscillospiraceae bacterium]|nr:23S rRNA (adenine(2503)-C(2))-methyltransferase RlmN [Oscillospiraceae bacterium]
MGATRYRGTQAFRWVNGARGIGGGLITDFGMMTDVPLGLRDRLRESYSLSWPEIKGESTLVREGTTKFLHRLWDGGHVESVLMAGGGDSAICVSSQVGCGRGCTFCASAGGGLSRNLTPSEMTGQVYGIMGMAGCKVGNVTVMGVGEPFDNYGSLISFLSILGDPDGLNVGSRNVTVSTCGISPMIREFAGEKGQTNLSVSLHAPEDGLRQALMPVAVHYPLEGLMDACEYYAARTNRRVTFEYTLIKGVNDKDTHAYRLATLLGGREGLQGLCHVNLMSYNEVGGCAYRRSSPERMSVFEARLKAARIPVTVRRTKGGGIGAACGQLRAGSGQGESG